jgi:hypothetical protein
MNLGFGAPPAHLVGGRLVMGPEDLDVISLLEGRDRLALWKYATASGRVRDQCRVFAFAELDEFHLYRSHRHSYYLSDEGRPTLISVQPDGAVALKTEVQDEYDFHGAEIEGGVSAEVALAHGERSIPIYALRDARDARLLVEGWPVPVWVYPPAEVQGRYRLLAVQLADFVSYWLWQLTTPLERSGTLAALAQGTLRFSVDIQIVEDEAWFDTDTSRSDEPLTVRSRAEGLTLSFTSRTGPAINAPTNAGERELVRTLIEGLADSAGQALAPETIDGILDDAAPLGLKKKMVGYDLSKDPRLDERGLPPPRHIQEADEGFLLDDLGQHLHELGYREGNLEEAEANNVLHAAVGYFYGRLRELVGSLDPEGLVEALVAANEALIARQATQELTTPTSLACFLTVPQMIERLEREIPQTSEASLATRFLVEYVAAQPSAGLRPFSRTVLDELLALSVQIHNMGYASDLLYYDLSDTQMSILGSRRLGFSRATSFEQGRRAYLNLHARREIARRAETFGRLWNEPASPPPEAATLDEAVKAEFDLTLTDFLSFHGTVMDIGYSLSGEPKVLPVERLQDQVANELSWAPEKVDTALRLHLLRPRDDFRGPGNRWAEVAPWHFNRPLSYVRRPLVLRAGSDGEEVVWGNRHVYTASRHFFFLCAGGRLPAESREMKSLLSKWRGDDARAFNDQVADVFRSRNMPTFVRVKKIAGLSIERVPGELLTDIDVLAIDRARKTIHVVETKALAPARTPRELAAERERTFVGRPGKKSEVEKVLDAAAWVTEHLDQILSHQGIDHSHGWDVQPAIVVEAELMTPFIRDVPVRVLTSEQLIGELSSRP